MTDELFYFNGIDGATGQYLTPPMTETALSRQITGEEPPENLSELKYRHTGKTSKSFGVKEGVDPKNLDQAGLGISFTLFVGHRHSEILEEYSTNVSSYDGVSTEGSIRKGLASGLPKVKSLWVLKCDRSPG